MELELIQHFSQYEIMKLGKMLSLVLVQDRNKRQHFIQHLFPHLKTSLPSELPHEGTIPTSPFGGVDLPSTIKLIVGGMVLDTITLNTECS